MAGRSRREGARARCRAVEGGREGGRARHSAFSFVSKGNHARILDGEKEVEGEERRGLLQTDRTEREGSRSDRLTALSPDRDKFFGGRVNAKGTYLFVPLCLPRALASSSSVTMGELKWEYFPIAPAAPPIHDDSPMEANVERMQKEWAKLGLSYRICLPSPPLPPAVTLSVCPSVPHPYFRQLLGVVRVTVSHPLLLLLLCGLQHPMLRPRPSPFPSVPSRQCFTTIG